MPVEQSIQPLNVAAATLLVQLFLITLIAVASSLYGTQHSPLSEDGLMSERRRLPPGQVRKSATLFVALASFAVLLISDELYLIWSPIFQGVGINTMSAATAIGLVFTMDLFLVGYLMSTSGGSRSSPFLAGLFTIPALAIFLRLPPGTFLVYTLVAALMYLLLLAPRFDRHQPSHSAAAFMNIACLLLSMFTGYITRPVPIGELESQRSAHSGPPSLPASAPASP